MRRAMMANAMLAVELANATAQYVHPLLAAQLNAAGAGPLNQPAGEGLFRVFEEKIAAP